MNGSKQSSEQKRAKNGHVAGASMDGTSRSKEKYLIQRMVCTRRTAHDGKPVEQAVRSCMHAYWIANNAKLATMNGSEGISGLPFREALASCDNCKTGKAYIDRYEKKFGPVKIFKKENIAIQAHKNRGYKHRENMCLLWTTIAVYAREGYPNY